MIRRTRIVATLGPASDPPHVLEALVRAGLDAARINFSHGDPSEHMRRIAAVRDTARRLGRVIAIIADLPGPKLRVRLSQPIELVPDQEISFAAQANIPADLSVTEPECIDDTKPGQRILLDDGRLQLVAVRREGPRLIARVLVGGVLKPNKGINLPDTPLTIPTLTDRDRQALNIAAQCDVEWLAVSFVRHESSAEEVRRAAAQLGLNACVMAKIERPEAVAQIRPIIDAFDGIMVARGDLGVEIPLERVPTVQKQVIQLARQAGKPVVTATDMLDSMRENPRPTRAEASDVANAIYDGSDALMLSGETAVGKYPVEALSCMDQIAREVDPQVADDDRYDLDLKDASADDQMTHLAYELARSVHADAIVTPTISGRSARLIARYRPRSAIIAPAATERAMRQLAIVWGVTPLLLESPLPVGADRMDAAVRSAFRRGAVQAGQSAVVLAGHPNEGGPHIPTIRLVRVGLGGLSGDPRT